MKKTHSVWLGMALTLLLAFPISGQPLPSPVADPQLNPESDCMAARGARVRAVRGGAEILGANRVWRTVRVNEVLPIGSLVRTREEGQMDLYFSEGGLVVRLEGMTTVKIDCFPIFDSDRATEAVAFVLEGGVLINSRQAGGHREYEVKDGLILCSQPRTIRE